MANNGDGWSDDAPMPWPLPDGEAGGPWVDMVRKAAGSAGVSMLSAPFGYAVTSIFKMLAPDPQMAALQEIRAIAVRIESAIQQAVKQIDGHLSELERGIDQKFRDLTEKILGSRLYEPLQFIDDFAGRLADDKDFAVDDKERQAIDLRVKMVCNAMLHDPMLGEEGYLAAVTECLQAHFKVESYASLGLLRAAYVLEGRFSRLLAQALRGLLLVELGQKRDRTSDPLPTRRARFVTDHLLPLLDRYQWCVEELVLDVLAKAPTRQSVGFPGQWRDQLNCAFYVFKQADQLALGAVSHLTHVPLPTTLLSGRVMGSRRSVALMRQRVEHLRALTSTAQTTLALAPSREETHQCLQIVDLHARGRTLGCPEVLIEREQSDVVVFRYWLGGFDSRHFEAVDQDPAAEPGTPVGDLRGTPSLDWICSHSAAWERRFEPIVIGWGAHAVMQDVRHRGELVLSIPLQPLAPTPGNDTLPWRLMARADAVWKMQLADKGHHAWNWGSAELAAGGAGKALVLPDQSAAVVSVALSHDATTITCGLEDGTINLLDADTGKLRTSIQDHRGAVRRLCFSHDDKTLIAGGVDGVVAFWDAATGSARQAAVQRPNSVASMALVPGTTQVLCVWDGDILLLDYSSGRIVRDLSRRDYTQTACAIASDATVFLLGNAGGYVHLRDLAEGRDLIPTCYQVDRDGGSGAIFVQLIPTAASSRLVTLAGPHGKASVWDLRTAEFSHTLGADDFRPTSGVLLADDTTVVLGEPGGRIQAFDVSTGKPLEHYCGALAAGVSAMAASRRHLWIATGKHLERWPHGLLPGTPVPAETRLCHNDDLMSWLDGAPKYPSSLLDGWAFRESLSPPDVARNRRTNQWVALSSHSGNTIYWVYENPTPNLPRRAKVPVLPADGQPFPWPHTNTPATTFGKFNAEPDRNSFFRIVPRDGDRVSLETASGSWVMVDKSGTLTFGDQNHTFTCTLLEGGRIALQASNGKFLHVPNPSGTHPEHAPYMVFEINRPVVAATRSTIDEQCHFTLHFVEPTVSPHPFWNDGSVLDAWHKQTHYFTYTGDFGGHGASRSWDGEVLARSGTSLSQISSDASISKARLKVEVWGVRTLLTGTLKPKDFYPSGKVRHRAQILVGASGTPGEPPKVADFVSIHDEWLDHERGMRIRTADGKAREPDITNGPPDTEFYCTATVELNASDSLWLRAMTELHMDWWTREENSWATIGVRIKDVRLSWA